MNKSPLLLLLITIFSLLNLETTAQIGVDALAGLSISSYRNDGLDSKGGTGIELGVGFFAKYSSRVEWNSRFSFLQTKRHDVNAYKLNSGYIGSTDLNDYSPTKIELNTSQMNITYSLSFYAIPDKLALIGGFDLGIDFFSGLKRLIKEDEFAPTVFLNIDSTSGSTPTVDYISLSDLKTAFLYYGPSFGLSYTFADRFIVYGKYTIFLNPIFKHEFADSYFELDQSKVSALRIGIGYKFLPSAKNRRF